MPVLWSSVQNPELCTLESGELDTDDTGQSKKNLTSQNESHLALSSTKIKGMCTQNIPS